MTSHKKSRHRLKNRIQIFEESPEEWNGLRLWQRQCSLDSRDQMIATESVRRGSVAIVDQQGVAKKVELCFFIFVK